jgi:hypothetical protein
VVFGWPFNPPKGKKSLYNKILKGEIMAHDDFSEIYRAKNMQEAELLKNRLAEDGIRATVMNNVLEGGAGSDVLGWATQPRVMVAQNDAEQARRIAMEYERCGPETITATDQLHEQDDSDDGWPCCPSCGRRRLTACPHCGTAGADFDEGDIDVDSLLDPSQSAPAPCCGPGGCGTTRSETSCHSERSEESEFSASPGKILLCPTCDEPFTPQYLGRCEWCGHRFPDGVEIELPTKPIPTVNRRLVVTIAALVLLVVIVAVYFFLLFLSPH